MVEVGSVFLWFKRRESIKRQAISRILSSPIIYLDLGLPQSSNRLPSNLGVLPSNTGLHGVSPHRVYLISLQPNCTCFLLHWSFRQWRRRMLSAMLHYGVRTFLPNPKIAAIRWPAAGKGNGIVNKNLGDTGRIKGIANSYFYIC